MKSLKSILLAVFLFAVVLPCYGGEYTLFGPQQYNGTTAKTITQTNTFSSPAVGSDFTLRLQNGDGQGHYLITSATVTLNGVQIIAPSDVKTGTPLIERQVSLKLANTLTVAVNSKTGSYLKITIVGQNNLVTVPNVVGVTQANAQSAITAAKLVVGPITTAFSSTVPSGSVISQNPAAGSSVAQGSAVALVVSTGPAPPVIVPNVVGMTQASAQSAITAANLVVGTVTTASSSTVSAGNVISQNPASGVSVAQGSTIALVVSSGPIKVSVPNVVGMTQTNANTTITTANLAVGTMTGAASTKVPAGSVISQTPASGTLVLPGTAVNLVISLGRTAVSVPNVVGMTQANAQSSIAAAKLVVGNVTLAYNDAVPKGNVISQNPTSGILVASGSAVSMIVSNGPTPVSAPSVLGMTQENAQTVIVAAKLVVGNVTSSNSITVPVGNVISQSPVSGVSVAQGTAVDIVISTGPASVSVPSVLGMTQTSAQAALAAMGLQIGGVTTVFSNNVAVGDVISQKPSVNTIVLQGTSVSMVISAGAAPLVIPPDPSSIAPPVDNTTAPSVAANTAFLYSGSNPIQTGVAPGTIQVKQAAVLRGQIYGNDENPLSGVTVTILNHPEFGQTVTRTDGMFDMAVNGGGILTVSYSKTGYLPAQRQVNAPWNDYAWLPEVVLLPFDNNTTSIDLTSSTSVQVARGSVSTDADGTRRATVFFAQGTSAQMVFTDGSTRPISTLTVRATEYTVGANGPKAMPGNLPPTSAYTYAVELSVDEANAAGATTVRFSQPVNFYVENFLNFPIGVIVPVGYYDSSKAAWVPSDNGRIIKVLSITNGLADLDTDGSGLNSDATKLAVLGITETERQKLASLYTPGQSLWRVAITHFTPWDCNWPNAPPPDAVSPDQPLPEMDKPLEDPCTKSGSIIECQNQTLGERVPIAGTPFSLNYRSNRVVGNTAGQTLRIPLSGAAIPASLRSIRLELHGAGVRMVQSFPPSPNLTYDYHWDGVDAYGRKIQGINKINVRIVYGYKAVNYAQAYSGKRAFAQPPQGSLIIGDTRSECYFETIQEYPATVHYWDERLRGLGAWSLNIHHDYDASNKKLYQGDGAIRTVDYSYFGIVSTFTGGNAATLNGSTGIKFGPDNSLYIADQYDVKKITPDGILSTIAGNGQNTGFSGDGGPATSAGLSGSNGVEDVAVAPDGTFYILVADYWSGNRVRRVGTDGIITTYVGYGQCGADGWGCYGGDGGLATYAGLRAPNGIAVGPDGSLYIADTGNARIRRVSPDGIITTVAGTGTVGHNGDGGSALNAQLSSPISIVVDKDNSIYFIDANYDLDSWGRASIVRRIAPDGIISIIASSDDFNSYGVRGIAVSPDGSVYVGTSNYVNKIALNGLVTTVAGCGNCWDKDVDGNLPKSTFLYGADGVAVALDGSLYIAESGRRRIRHVSSIPSSQISLTEFTVSSEDGSQLYVFNGLGKHIRTINALTNATLYQFGYDTGGRLVTITDGDVNITTIERDSFGNPVAIVAPFGQRTQLTLDANGYINSITNPAAEVTRMTYTTDGLLTSFVDPKGNASQLTYDEKGLLIRDEDALGGFTALSSIRSSNSSLVTLTTALNRTTTYLSEDLFNDDQRRTITLPSGAQTIQFKGRTGIDQNIAPDATVTTTTKKPDPRFDMQAPLASITNKMPSGLTSTLATSRFITYTDPNNYLSLATQTDTLSVNSRVYTTLFDAMLKQSTTTTPAGRQTVALTDSQGRPLSFTLDPTIAPMTFTYNTRGKLVQAAQGNQQTTYGYDLLGRVASQSDVLGHTVNYGYDDADRLTQLTLPSGHAYRFGYDANGNRTQITMPSGDVHKLGYTIINLSSDYTPPDNLPYAWKYSLDKEWIKTILPGGRSIDAAYDTGSGRPLGIIYPEATVSLNYGDLTDRVSRIIRTPSAGGTAQQITFTYDGSLVTGRSFAGVTNGLFSYIYDNNFFLKQINLTSGTDSVATPITRDADGLVTGYGPFTFTRNGPAGAVSQIGDTAANVAIIYDNLGRVATRSHTVNGKNIYSIQFTYDSRGNISRKIETVSGETNTWDYTYDDDGQLTAVKENGVDEELYVYDVNGNRKSYEQPGAWSVLADYDAQDRLVRLGGTIYQFNADGQLTQRGTDTFQYSAQGELLQATVEGQAITYTYDGTGRRVARKDSTGTTQYLYGNQSNPFQLTAQRDPAGVLSTFYYDNGGTLFAYDKGGVRYYVASDQVGTPKVVSDATGAVVKFLEYDSFGMPTFDSNPDLSLPVGFAGGLTDDKTGLVRFGYRDYEPGTGRWTAKDPIFFGGGQGNLYVYVDSVGKPPVPQTNLYQYTENNPVNKTDPLGLWSVSIGAGGFGNIGMLGAGADSGVAISNNNVCFYSNICGAGGWNTPAGGSLGLVGQFSKGNKLCSGEEKAQGGYWYGGAGLGGEGQIMTDGNGVQYGRGLIGVTGGAGAGYMRCTTRYYCVR